MKKQEPPEQTTRGPSLSDVIAELKRNVGIWYLVATYNNSASASARRYQLRKRGAETRSARAGSGAFEVYARILR